MAVCIEYEIKEDIYDGEVEVKDFAILGYKRITEHTACLLYYFSDKNDTVYMVQNSFLIGEEDKEFLDNPINYFMDIDKLSNRDKETFDRIINEMTTSEKCYYTSFVPCKIKIKAESITWKDGCISNSVTCKASSIIDGKQHVIDFIIPINIFIRLQIMKNRMIFGIPANVFIDQDDKYNNIKLHEKCDIQYFGCDPSNKDFIIALYVLKTSDQRIGLAVPTPSFNEIVTTKTIKIDQFTKLFPNSYSINMTKIIMADWVDDYNKPCRRVCVYIVNEDSISVYMMDDDPKDSILMKPHDMIFSEGV